MNSITTFFSGEMWFSVAEIIWKVLLKKSVVLLVKNPTTGNGYSDAWKIVNGIYDILNIIAVTLFVLFFVYGFLRECIDVKHSLTGESIIKMFIRLVICSNVMTLCLSYMSKLIGWASSLVKVVSLDAVNDGAFFFDGKDIYKQIDDGLVCFLLGFVFVLVVGVSGIMILFTITKRFLTIYMVAPFASLALSTLVAGGGTAQVGYQYIKAFLGYVFSVLLMAVALAVSPAFVSVLELSGNGIISLIEIFVRVISIAGVIKGIDSICQHFFGL